MQIDVLLTESEIAEARHAGAAYEHACFLALKAEAGRTGHKAIQRLPVPRFDHPRLTEAFQRGRVTYLRANAARDDSAGFQL